MTFLTGYQSHQILATIKAGGESLDIVCGPKGQIQSLAIDTLGCEFLPDGPRISLEDLDRMAKPLHGFFLYQDDKWQKQVMFSPETKLQVGLYATETGTPALMVGGFPMHRHKHIDPWNSSKAMVDSVPRVYGRVLDTTCGLGYVTLSASERAVSVTSLEVDPGVCRLHHSSPWSAPLYTTSNIKVVQTSCVDFVTAAPDSSYDVVFHDPPTVQIAGDLYSAKFYREIHRTLSSKGVFFHYIGSPESRSGSTMMRGTKRRLSEAGFDKVVQVDRAFGLLASKLGKSY